MKIILSILAVYGLVFCFVASSHSGPLGTAMGDRLEQFGGSARPIFPKPESMSRIGYERLIKCIAVDPASVPAANSDVSKVILFFYRERLIAIYAVLKDLPFDQANTRFDIYKDEFGKKYGKAREDSKDKTIWEADKEQTMVDDLKKVFVYKRKYKDAFVEYKDQTVIGFIYKNHLEYNREVQDDIMFKAKMKQDELDAKERLRQHEERIKVRKMIQ